MILSHHRAGTGMVLVETREEARFLKEMLAELPDGVEVATVPAGQRGAPLTDARTGKAVAGYADLAGLYAWLQKGPNRVGLGYDFHRMINSPSAWRGAITALPGVRCPDGADRAGIGSLLVFVAPAWTLDADNPLRGGVPILKFAPPTRAALSQMADRLLPANGMGDAIADALAGLDEDTAEQAAAECVEANGGWNLDHLYRAKVQALRDVGLDVWPTQPELGGLDALKDDIETEVLPFLRDPTLAVRRFLCAGVPGVGKSFWGRFLGHRIGCKVVEFNPTKCKQGIVGATEAATERVLARLDAQAAEAPLVVIMDEVDKLATEGLDSGASSGIYQRLLTWLQESRSLCLVIATLNRLDKLDAALESRFHFRYFFDLPNPDERQAIAAIHYRRVGCPDDMAELTARHTDGFSSREIAESVCPAVARSTTRRPTPDAVVRACQSFIPASRTQAEQLEKMRRSATGLRRASADPGPARPGGRKIGGAK